MVKLVAISRGYYGGVIRDPGDTFDFPDDAWKDEKRRPSWAKIPADSLFGGKGDHDGDGIVGGSVSKRSRKPKAEVFEDAPEPLTIAEAHKEIGNFTPDWLPPEPKPIDD